METKTKKLRVSSATNSKFIYATERDVHPHYFQRVKNYTKVEAIIEFPGAPLPPAPSSPVPSTPGVPSPSVPGMPGTPAPSGPITPTATVI